MKKIISVIAVLAVAACLTACREINSLAENIPDDSTSSHSSMPSEESALSQSTTSSEESTLSDTSSSYQSDLGLEGEELIATFEWPFDDPIDLLGMTAKAEKTAGTIEDIPLFEISNDFSWYIICDYGYLAMMPEAGNEYEYKKYKEHDKIGDFTVAEISTWFDNRNYEFMKYFSGTRANFEGEIALTGEISIVSGDYSDSGEIKFYPDEESRKKFPIVNFVPKLNVSDIGEYYSNTFDNLVIGLGDRTDYPEIEFKKIPADGTRVKVKIKIKDYSYRAQFGLPFLAGATIVNGSFEAL